MTMDRTLVLAGAQKTVSILKESGWWEVAAVDPFWEQTHAFVVETLAQENPQIVQEMNARYMAERYFNVAGAFYDTAGDLTDPPSREYNRE